jgi:ABC-type transport system involved in multi-copper enzyme maturation permease subunit
VSLLRSIWAWLEDLQHRTPIRVALSVVAVVVVVSFFGYAWWAASDARDRFDSVVDVLRGVNRTADDPVTTRLLETGEIAIDGRTYGGPRVKAGIDAFFDVSTGELLQVAEISAILIAETIPDWIPAAVIDRPGFIVICGAFALIWVLVVVWTGVFLPVMVATIATLMLAAVPWIRGYDGVVVTIIGIGLLVTTFLLMARVLILALGVIASPSSRPGRHGNPGVIVQIAAVAQTLVRESLRLRISVAFIVVMLVTLPIIPLWIDPEEPIRYQVQNFLSDSMTLVYVLAACMTLVLSCATVSFEIRDRQIWHLATKPLGRVQYLLGKWAGIVLLDALLLAIGGASIYGFAQYLGSRADDPLAMIEVNDEVLTARIGVTPRLDQLGESQVKELAYAEFQNDPITREKVERGEADEFNVIRGIVRRLRQEHLDRQRSVAPGGFNENRQYDARVYEFLGLNAARRAERNLTLRYKFHIGRSESTDRYPVVFRFPATGDEIQQMVVPEQRQRLLLPAELIDEDGVLRMQVLNGGFSETPSEATRAFFANGATLIFDSDGLEVLWQAASFESNFTRALVIDWIKLAFLGMLGITAATFLSFPVAILLAFTIFVGGSMTPFISDSLGQFRPDADTVAPIRIAQTVIAAVARSIEWLLRPFGESSPNRLVVEGRLVSLGDLFRNLMVIGAFWCGATLFIGWWVFRRRELATYSGHG